MNGSRLKSLQPLHTMKNKSLKEAYEHGKQAFTLGMSSRACPYTDAAHVQAWEDGFLHAKFSAPKLA